MALPAWNRDLPCNFFVHIATQDSASKVLRLLSINHFWRIYLNLRDQTTLGFQITVDSTISERVSLRINAFYCCAGLLEVAHYIIDFLTGDDNRISRQVLDSCGIALVVVDDFLHGALFGFDWRLGYSTTISCCYLIRQRVDLNFRGGGFRIYGCKIFRKHLLPFGIRTFFRFLWRVRQIFARRRS
ncbi:hypothetical protein ASD28_22770 [Massilia sp. Root133]|nr:hypothetical protein ASD28_22770 [Massilia sp. Root133]KQZ46877.1 hypothetical protein ASD92_23670 [Massilia sp. Root1485]